VTVSYNTLGDMLLRRYIKDFIAEMAENSVLRPDKMVWDLEKVIKKVENINFGDLYGDALETES